MLPLTFVDRKSSVDSSILFCHHKMLHELCSAMRLPLASLLRLGPRGAGCQMERLDDWSVPRISTGSVKSGNGTDGIKARF